MASVSGPKRIELTRLRSPLAARSLPIVDRASTTPPKPGRRRPPAATTIILPPPIPLRRTVYDQEKQSATSWNDNEETRTTSGHHHRQEEPSDLTTCQRVSANPTPGESVDGKGKCYFEIGCTYSSQAYSLPGRKTGSSPPTPSASASAAVFGSGVISPSHHQLDLTALAQFGGGHRRASAAAAELARFRSQYRPARDRSLHRPVVKIEERTNVDLAEDPLGILDMIPAQSALPPRRLLACDREPGYSTRFEHLTTFPHLIVPTRASGVRPTPSTYYSES